MVVAPALPLCHLARYDDTAGAASHAGRDLELLGLLLGKLLGQNARFACFIEKTTIATSKNANHVVFVRMEIDKKRQLIQPLETAAAHLRASSTVDSATNLDPILSQQRHVR